MGPVCGACPGATFAAGPSLKPELGGIAFLLGDWTSGKGRVADTGATSTGSSSFKAEAGGGVLLRRDRTGLFGPKGQKMGGFDQVMMSYPEAGTLRADYAEGTHIIRYVSAAVVPGRSVIFTSAPARGPAFRLATTRDTPTELKLSFAMCRPAAPSSGRLPPAA